MLNVDEILRIPSNKLLINLRGNKPLLLDKMIYTEHPVAVKLKDSNITEYNPDWVKKENIDEKPKKQNKEVRKVRVKVREKLSWKIL